MTINLTGAQGQPSSGWLVTHEDEEEQTAYCLHDEAGDVALSQVTQFADGSPRDERVCFSMDKKAFVELVINAGKAGLLRDEDIARFTGAL